MIFEDFQFLKLDYIYTYVFQNKRTKNILQYIKYEYINCN